MEVHALLLRVLLGVLLSDRWQAVARAEGCEHRPRGGGGGPDGALGFGARHLLAPFRGAGGGGRRDRAAVPAVGGQIRPMTD